MKSNFLNKTLKGTKLYILLTLILSAIYSRLLVYIPMFIQYALDGVIIGDETVIPKLIRNLFYAEDKISKILVLAFVLVIVNILVFLVNYLKSKINTKFNLIINRNVKEIVLEHIPKINYMEFSNIDKSNVIQRVNNDATTYSEFFNSQINLFFDTIFIIIFAIAQTLKLNSTVGIFIAIICFLIVLLSIWYFKISRPLVEDIVDMNREVIDKTTISVEESKMLKIFNRQDKEIEDFSKMNNEYKRKDIKLAKIKILYVIGTHTLRNFKEPFILLWGGILVVKGELTLATISILLTYSTKILEYIYKSVDKLKETNEFITAYKKLSNLMKLDEDIETKPDVTLNGSIIFDNVSIKINNNELLNNLTFTINPNENIAIIGDNGTGKTVISKTLLGFYDYTGNIFIGEHDIKDVSKKSLRNYIGVVLQDTYLFTNTVEENIKITNPLAKKENIIKICQKLNLHDKIMSLKNGYETRISSDTDIFSAGEKQLLNFTRVMVEDPEIIILDEATASLSYKSEMLVRKAIDEITKGKISFIIAHRLSTIKNCDKILLLKNGKILEQGNHNELIENKGEYYQLINS